MRKAAKELAIVAGVLVFIAIAMGAILEIETNQ
jgi:hypothetical protein